MSKAKKETELVEKPDTALATGMTSSGAFSSGIDASDIIIPKILLMQAISDLVEKEVAKSGDFVHSLDETVIGSKEANPIEFIVLSMYKTLQTYENNEYVKTEALTPENAQLPYTETNSQGVVISRSKVMNYYVIRPSDVEAMQVFPMVISFKRTSLKGGRKLATKLTMLEEFGAETYMKTFKLVAKQEEGDKGKYYVLDVLDGRKSNEVELRHAVKWLERLKTAKVKVHEVDEEESARAGTPAGGPANDNIDF